MTQRQVDLLEFLTAYIIEHNGRVPSFAEMMKALGLTSKSSIARLLDGLEQRGHIQRIRRANRAIKLLD